MKLTYLSDQATFQHDQKFKTKILISWEREELLRWNKKHFWSFLKRPSVIKYCLRLESAPLKECQYQKHKENQISTAPIVVLDPPPRRSNQRKGTKILPQNNYCRDYQYFLHKSKPGTLSENLLNEIRQIVHSLYQGKQSKKVYNNLVKST